jgi:hypothetical protein
MGMSKINSRFKDLKDDPRLQGSDLRFGGRTLSAELVFDHPSFEDNREACNAVANHLRLAASGPLQRMTCVLASFRDSTATITLVVNTDELEGALQERLRASLEAQGVPTAILTIGELETQGAAAFWEKVKEDAERSIEAERRRS